MKNKKKMIRSTGAVLVLSTMSTMVLAEGFFEDSRATFIAKNFYFNRDFRDGPGQSKRDEWGQSFLIDYRSGYTQGWVGFGVDAIGMLGLKLDSSPDRINSGLLPVHNDGRAPGEFSKGGVMGKVKVSNTELKFGNGFQPVQPTLVGNNGRMLPQVFQGVTLDSNEIKSLALTGVRFDRETDRAQAAAEDLALFNKNGRFRGTVESDHFTMGGGTYKVAPNLALTYQNAVLEDIYRQQYFGLVHTAQLGEAKLKSDIRYFVSDEAGSGKGGKVDSRSLSGAFTYSLLSHALTFAYVHNGGDTSVPYVNGTDIYLPNFVLINDFDEPEERSWQLRYDFDFARLGIPGLTFRALYASGDNISLKSGGEGDEWERDFEMQYVVQSGLLKNLGVRWRNGMARNNFSRDVDENRLILTYTLALF
ncbi:MULTISPECIES: OprD family porin [unclassified Pseudomonas]|uniref:OprD family porin n=1 Tax=unclassified Pseudomonas TaxID=196821 RepID=UPI000D3459BC|nr:MULTISPECIES: OprD family porin [unclassified Pseudomonas]RAU47986.1 porin [Pseudomonas sp. RIT 409]RAU55320.1 porin [Pseudomonas sp. RIT 412]